MRIVVLGGSGLIGQQVLSALKDFDVDHVAATYNRRPPTSENKDVEWLKADLLDPNSSAKAIEDATAVISCAGIVASSPVIRNDPVAPILANLRISMNALEGAAHAEVERFVWISSATGYPESAINPIKENQFFDADPPGAWYGVGWMTRYLETQCRWYSEVLAKIKHVVALRPTMIYGPGDDFNYESGHFVPSMLRRVVEREPVIEIWGDGEQKRDLIHARDVASAALAALESKKAYSSYNVASGASVSINEVVKLLIEIDDYDTARVCHLKDKGRPISDRQFSIDAIHKDLGFHPQVSLEDGLRETIEWYRATLELDDGNNCH